MLLVYYKNITQCVIRPAPLVSISYTPLKNKNGQFGGTYELTLTGAILADEGSPFYSGAPLLTNTDAASTGAFSNNYDRPPSEIIPYGLEGEQFGGRARARLDSKTHHFLSDDHPSKKKVRAGTHHFFGGDLQREVHSRKKICEHCGKEVGLPNYGRWHGPNCRMHLRKL